MVLSDSPEGAIQQGLRIATDEEADAFATKLDFGTVGAQLQAQGERVLRGATLGAVEGFGEPEDIRVRAEVSEELSPVTSFAATLVPDIAVGALTGGFGGLATGAGRAAAGTALRSGAGLARAGLAAGRAGGAAALAGESLGVGAVAAGQEAYAEERSAVDDPGKFAEDVLFWGGLNFGLGKLIGAGKASESLKLKSTHEAASISESELDEIAQAAEYEAAGKVPEGAPETPAAVPETAAQEGAGAAAPVAPAGGSIEDLSRQFNEMTGLTPKRPDPAPIKAPLDDVRMLDDEGMLDRVEPTDPRLVAVAPELDQLRTQGLGNLSLDELRALPIDDEAFPQATADSRKKIDFMREDETFRREGMLAGARDRERGGLPIIGIEPEATYLINGRHRLTAAREAGLDEIVMNVKKYDSDGNTLWDYVGPVRIKEAAAGAALGGSAALTGEDQPEAAAAAGAGGLALLLGKRGLRGMTREAATENVRLLEGMGHQVKQPEHLAKLLERTFERPLTEDQWNRIFPADSLARMAGTAPGQSFITPYLATGDLAWRSHGPDNAWTISRLLKREESGDLVADHSLFILGKELQGGGKGAQLIRDQMTAYRELGVDRVVIDNALDVGKYFWPSIGFDNPSAVDGAKKEFSEWLASGKAGETWSRADANAYSESIKSLPSLAARPEGKEFLLNVDGPWNEGLSLQLKDDNPMFHMMKQRLDIAAAGAMVIGGSLAGSQEEAEAAGIGGLGLLLGRRFGKAFARRAATEAAEDGMARALRNASKTNADDIVARATRGVETEADSLGRQRRLYMNRGPILEVAAREMQQDLTQVAKDVQQVTRVEKLAAVATHVSDNIAAQKSAARVISEDAAKFAGELRGEARAYAAASGKKGLQYAITGQKAWTLALIDHAKQVGEATTGKALFEALDGFKRAAQDFKLSLEAGALNSDNPIHHQALIPRIEAFARQIRTTLEDSGTWGRAGDMQRSYNAVIHDKLVPSMRVFEEAVLKRTHRGYDGLWNTEGWESKIAGLLRNKDPGERRHVAAVLDGMDELASVRRQYGDAKTADRIEERTAKVRRTMGLADEVEDASERMQAIGEVVGAVPLGGMIRGFVTGDVFAAYQRLAGASEEAIGRGVDDWIRSSRLRGRGVRLPKVLESDEARQLSELAKRRGISQTMVLFQGDDDSPGAAFERWRDAMLDDEKFFDELGQDYDTLNRSEPDAFLMLSGRADLARQFLIQRMPPNVAVSMAQPNGYPPSRESVEDWAEYVVAVRDPRRVIANVGAMSQPQVEALRTVYPRRHEQLQQRVIEAIATANERGEPLDDTFMVRAGLLFPDVDGVGSPVFSREYGNAVREYNQGQQQAQQQRSGRPGKAPTNPLNATIQGGATFGHGF